ncbi:MAG: RNA polymerase sigma factor, partial [Planctomycetota bacterium]
MVEDRLLLWRFKNGNEDSLCRIYEKHRTRLLKLANALSNDKDLAEDVVQDVFVSFAQSAKRLRIGGNLRAYLATGVANRIRNRFRDDRGKQHISLDSADSVASEAKTPQQWVIYSEDMRKMNEALEQVPYEQREVVLLHVHGGMKFKAISQVQKVSINTVQSRYRYA